MVECKIHTSPSLPLCQAHSLAEKVEQYITGTYRDVESVFIHVEPSRRNILSAIIPVKEINGLDSRVHGHFGRAPYYIILKIADKEAETEDFYYNEFLAEKQHIGSKVIKTVIKYKLDMLFTSRIGELSFYMLKENFVDIYKAQEDIPARVIIEEYRKDRLQPLTAPTHPVEESQVGK